MAIYHFHAQNISRGAGRSAVGAAAYRHRSSMKNRATGKTFNYTGSKDLVHSEFVAPEKTPLWFRNLIDGRTSEKASEAFWSKIERENRRANSTFAKEIVIALPNELSREQNIALMRDYVQQSFSSRGIVADWVYHEKGNNPHVHVMIAVQPLTQEGFGKRLSPALDADGNVLRNEDDKIIYRHFAGDREDLREWRARWSEVANVHLKQAGLDIEIDHRSLKTLGLTVKPNRHLGVELSRLEKEGKAQFITDIREERRQENEKNILDNPSQLIKLVARGESVFSRDDLIRVARKYVSNEEALETVVQSALQSEGLVHTRGDLMDWTTGEYENQVIYARKDILEAETRMMSSVQSMRMTSGHGVKERHVNRAIDTLTQELKASIGEHASLSDMQVNAIRDATKDSGLSCIVGYAGAGKSTMLKAANLAWNADGKRVFGASLSGKATQGLQESSNIESRTLASWEYNWNRGKHDLHVGDVLVIDEAGMVSSQQLSRFVTYCEEKGAKLVLVGDWFQLAPIEGGAGFRAIAERTGYTVLDDVRRQKQDWQKEATINFATGKIDTALRTYEQNNSVAFHDNYSSTISAVVNDYLAFKEQGSTLILAHANVDVQAINAATRNTMKERGELQNGILFNTSRGQKEFASGDRVLFLKNEKDVQNGLFATVVSVGDNVLNVKLDNGDTRTVTPSEYKYFDHGYAATVHKSQGATVDRAVVYGSYMMDRHLSYVALSRHREEVKLHVNGEEIKDMPSLVSRLSRDMGSRTTLDYEGWPREEKQPSFFEQLKEKLYAKGEAIELKIRDHFSKTPAEEIEKKPVLERPIEPVQKDNVILEHQKPTVQEIQISDLVTDRKLSEERPLISEIEVPGNIQDLGYQEALKSRSWIQAKEATQRASTSVWKEPKEAAKIIEERIRAGEKGSVLSNAVTFTPEAFGELRGKEGGFLISRSKAGKERELAKNDAVFVGRQVLEQAHIWQETVVREQERAALKKIRMEHSVPRLSERTEAYLRTLKEKRELEPENYRLTVIRTSERNQDIVDEIKRYDEALSKRFGVDAFTKEAKDNPRNYLVDSQQKHLYRLQEQGTEVRAFMTELQGQETRTRNQERFRMEENDLVKERLDPTRQHAMVEDTSKSRGLSKEQIKQATDNIRKRQEQLQKEARLDKNKDAGLSLEK